MADILPLRDGSILVGMTSRSDQGEFGIVQRLFGPDPNPRPYFNIRFPLNVSAAQGDDSVTPLDVLMVVNQLNQRSDPPIGFVDTDGDGEVTPLDVLRIVNFLNRTNLPSSGEGEKPNNNVETRTHSNFLDIDQRIADWESEDLELKRKSNSNRSRK